MPDLIQALNICLKFTPATRVPGLNGVFFDFTQEDVVKLYATDGHMMLRLKLVGIPVAVTDEPYYLPDKEVKRIIDTFSSDDAITISAWGDDIMFISGTEVVTTHWVKDEYNGAYRAFFDPHTSIARMTIDFDRFARGMNLLTPVLAAYKSCGPAFTISLGEHEDGNGMATVTPKIIQELPNLESARLVIMGLTV